MATHSSVLAWRIPGMGEPGGLPSMGSHRVGHDWSDLAAAAAGKTTRVGCHFFLQGIFPTQGLKPGVLHCRQILYQLSDEGSLWVCILRLILTKIYLYIVNCSRKELRTIAKLLEFSFPFLKLLLKVVFMRCSLFRWNTHHLSCPSCSLET